MKQIFTPTRIALVITAAWVIGAGIVFSRVSPGELPTKLNEWGDFMAGVFAPIAFVWLVTAVWIQSAELREQREELKLTRQEFQEQREVMKDQREAMQAQVEEAKRQAVFIGTQTRILEAEEARREFVETDRQFQARIETLYGLLVDVPDALDVKGGDAMEFEFPMLNTDGSQALHGLGGLMHELYVQFAKFVEGNTQPYYYANPGPFMRVKEHLDALTALQPRLSPGLGLTAERYQFGLAAIIAGQLANIVGPSPETDGASDEEAGPSPDEGD